MPSRASAFSAARISASTARSIGRRLGRPRDLAREPARLLEVVRDDLDELLAARRSAAVQSANAHVQRDRRRFGSRPYATSRIRTCLNAHSRSPATDDVSRSRTKSRRSSAAEDSVELQAVGRHRLPA